jgi:hypothetical protein
MYGNDANANTQPQAGGVNSSQDEYLSATSQPGTEDNDSEMEDETDDDDGDSDITMTGDEEEVTVTEEQIAEIKKVPTAAATKRSVVSLSNLCIAKILSAKMAHQQEFVFEDVDGYALENAGEVMKARIEMFTNPKFETDIDNLNACWEVVSVEFGLWFPQTWREISVLRQFGSILALRAIAEPAAQLAAQNCFNYMMHLDYNRHLNFPTHFGYMVTFANLPDITISLCGAINNLANRMVSMFTEIQRSMDDSDIPLHNHVGEFMKKYLPEYYHNEPRQSGWLATH